MNTEREPRGPGPLVASLIVGIVVGAGVAAAINTLIYMAPFGFEHGGRILTGFWGLVFGSFAALTAFGLCLALLSRGSGRHIGRWLAAGVLLLFALLVAFWIAMWGVTPFTQEGWWQYGLAIVALVGAILVSRGRRHPSRSERVARELRF